MGIFLLLSASYSICELAALARIPLTTWHHLADNARIAKKKKKLLSTKELYAVEVKMIA